MPSAASASYSGKYPMHEEQARRKAEQEDAAHADANERCFLRGLYCVEGCAATSHRDCPRYLRGESPLPLFLLEEIERLRAALANIGREDRLLSPSTLRKLAREALDG